MLIMHCHFFVKQDLFEFEFLRNKITSVFIGFKNPKMKFNNHYYLLLDFNTNVERNTNRAFISFDAVSLEDL